MYGIPGHKPCRKTGAAIGLAVCAFELTSDVPNEIQLTPAGLFRARDGRPRELPGWRIDADTAARVMARMRGQEDDFLVDYEHQTLYSEKNGQPAPAAGWFRADDLEWREGRGLFATDVQWTDAAARAIAAREYRYISPVIEYDQRTGDVLGIRMAALVNYAAIDGLSDLAAVAAAKFNLDAEGDPVMDEETLALLGLSADATQEQISAAVAALKARADNADQAEAEVAALKAAAGEEPDPAKYVAVETMQDLQREVAALKSQINGREIDALVDTALEDGRLLPAQEDWARKLGHSDLAALKGYLDNARPIAALNGNQTGGQPPAAPGTEGLTDDELAVCKATGIDPDEFKKLKTA